MLINLIRFKYNYFSSLEYYFSYVAQTSLFKKPWLKFFQRTGIF